MWHGTRPLLKKKRLISARTVDDTFPIKKTIMCMSHTANNPSDIRVHSTISLATCRTLLWAVRCGREQDMGHSALLEGACSRKGADDSPVRQ